MRKILLFSVLSLIFISCSNPFSSDDESDKEIWIVGNDSTITWNGNKIKELGVAEVFGPGTPMEETIEFIRNNVPERA